MEVKPTNFCFDKRLYSKEALMKAAYRFTDMFYIHLSIQGDNYIVSLLPKHSGKLFLKKSLKMNYWHKWFVLMFRIKQKNCEHF